MASLNVPPVPTSPRYEAIQLHRAFKGFTCDAATVINILAHRDATQRALIEEEYRTMYPEELKSRIASKLGIKLQRAILLWMPDPAGRDATIVRQAISRDTYYFSLRTTTEVICSRTSTQIQLLKQAYYRKFHNYLEHDILCQASGNHQKLLMAYISNIRYEGPEVDKASAEHDARSLYNAGEKRFGTDEVTFIRIFTERSRAHLAAISSAYHRMYRHSLGKAIKGETSGNFEFALLTILRCAENLGKYFAKVLHKAMKGVGTDDSTLIRVVVTRAEIDMQYIKAEYQKKYGKSLNDVVHCETSGNYRTFLLSLLGVDHR